MDLHDDGEVALDVVHLDFVPVFFFLAPHQGFQGRDTYVMEARVHHKLLVKWLWHRDLRL